MEHLSLENALGVPIPGDSTIKAQAQPRAGGGWQCWLHSEVSAPNGRSASCVMTAVSQGPPKSRIPSTRRRPCALLNPKPQHLQLNDRFPAILKLLSKMLQSKMTHSIFFLHRGFQKTVQICVCAEVQLKRAASMEAVGLPAIPPTIKTLPCARLARSTPEPTPLTEGDPLQLSKRSAEQRVLIWLAALGVAISLYTHTHTHTQLLTPQCTGKNWTAESNFLSEFLVLGGPLTTSPPLESPPRPPWAASFTTRTSY